MTRARLRLPVVVALGFAGVVLVTSMPVSALLTQRHQLASTSSALAEARAADRTLRADDKALRNPATLAALARTDYGMVGPGQKAYVILPPAGSSSATVLGSGHVPLGLAPIVPGSALSQVLVGLASPTSTSKSTSDPPGHISSTGRSRLGSGPAVQGSFWTRVARTLEFWR